MMSDDRYVKCSQFIFSVLFLIIFCSELTFGSLHERLDFFLKRRNGGTMSRNVQFRTYEDMLGVEFADEHRKKRSNSGREPGDQFEWRVNEVLKRNIMTGSRNMEMFAEHWGVGDNDGRCLFMTIYYLMHHKFFDYDWRHLGPGDLPNAPTYGKSYSKTEYQDENRGRHTTHGIEPEMGFLRNFPMPVVEYWPSELVEACTDSVHRCVREIAYVANQNDEFYLLLSSLEVEWATRVDEFANGERRKFVYTQNWRRERAFIDIGHLPWKDRQSAFDFTSVASYFMCFYALQREGFLISMPFDPHCHRMYIYSMKGYADEPFGCAELAFCADPCWGESKYGYDIVLYEFDAGIRMGKPTNNPCWQMQGGRHNLCNILNIFTQPVNFMDLQMSKLNFSCNCTEGYRYSMITRQCEDIDECEDTVLNTCKPAAFEICRNGIGSFHCSCQRGYRSTGEGSPCTRDEKIALYTMKKDYGYIEMIQEEAVHKKGDIFLKKLHDLKNLPKKFTAFIKDKLAIVFPSLRKKFSKTVSGD